MISGPKHLERVTAYVPGASPEDIQRDFGLSNVEKLASNENPFGPSPLGMAAARQALTAAHLYPDGGMKLRAHLAEREGVSTDGITVNNGSDAIIHQVMRTFLLPGETALSSRGGFVSFGIAVMAAGFEPKYVEMAPGYRFDVEALIGAIDDSTKIIYIPNPNNPTGTYLTMDEMEWFLERVPEDILVVIDEAYNEYASFLNSDTFPRSAEMNLENVLTLRTFSKAYGLAGLRVGYAIGHPDVIRWLLKTKLPFDPNGPASAAAIAAMSDSDFLKKTLETNASGLALLQSTLLEHGFVAPTSTTNFVMVECGTDENATAFHRSLLERGFISRPLRGGFALPTCVRISTGTTEQNVRLSAVLAELAELYAVS